MLGKRRPRVRIRYRDGDWRPRTLVAVPLGGGWVALHPPRDGVIVLSPLQVGRLRGCLRVAVMASAEQDPDERAPHGSCTDSNAGTHRPTGRGTGHDSSPRSVPSTLAAVGSVLSPQPL